MPDPAESRSLSDHSMREAAKRAWAFLYERGMAPDPDSMLVDAPGIWEQHLDGIEAMLREAVSGDPTDPSTDLENVNAAYVIERDDNARLRAEIAKLHAERQESRRWETLRERDRLRAEVERLREALDEIVDDLSVPNRPAPWAAHALQVAQTALAVDGETR